MSFSINVLKKPKIKGEIERELVFDKLQMTLVVKHDAEFNSAFAKVQNSLQQEKSLSKDSLKRGSQSQITTNEALLFVIGEYCVKSWNVDDGKEPLEPNGENLLMLCENFGGNQEVLANFLTDLINLFSEMVQTFGKQNEEVKKKPLKATSGNKTD